MSVRAKDKCNRSASLRKVAHQVLSKEECQTFKAALRAFRETTTAGQLIDSLEKILDSPKKMNLLREIALLLPLEQRQEFIDRSKRKFKGAELLLQEEYIANEAAVRSRQKSSSESTCSAGYPIAGSAVKRHSTFSGKRASSHYLGLPDAGLRKLQQAAGICEKITLADSAPIRRLKDDSAPKVIKLNSATFQVRYKSQLLLSQLPEQLQQDTKYQSLGPVRQQAQIPTIKEESPTDDAQKGREQSRADPEEDLMERIKNQVIKPRAPLSQLQDKGFWALNSPRRELQEQRRKERNLLQESADKLIEEQIDSDSNSNQGQHSRSDSNSGHSQSEHKQNEQSPILHEVLVHEEQANQQSLQPNLLQNLSPDLQPNLLQNLSPESQKSEKKPQTKEKDKSSANYQQKQEGKHFNQQKQQLKKERSDFNDGHTQPSAEADSHSYLQPVTNGGKKKRLSFDDQCKEESLLSTDTSAKQEEEHRESLSVSNHVTLQPVQLEVDPESHDKCAIEEKLVKPTSVSEDHSVKDELKDRKVGEDDQKCTEAEVACDRKQQQYFSKSKSAANQLPAVDGLQHEVQQQQQRLQQQLQQQQFALHLAEEKKLTEQQPQQLQQQPAIQLAAEKKLAEEQQQQQQQIPFNSPYQNNNFMLQWMMMQQAAAAAAAAAVTSPQALGSSFSSQPLEFLQQLYGQSQFLNFQQYQQHQQQQLNQGRQEELLRVTLVKSDGTFGLSIMSDKEGDRCVVLVSSVATGSPACKQGIQAGDEVVELEGESVTNMSLHQLAMAIRSQDTIHLAIRSRQR